MIARIVVEFPAADVLTALWYGDGSGARTSIGVDGPPNEYQIEQVELCHGGRTVRLVLVPAVEGVSG